MNENVTQKRGGGRGGEGGGGVEKVPDEVDQDYRSGISAARAFHIRIPHPGIYTHPSAGSYY